MSPDEIASIQEMIGELRGQIGMLARQIDQFHAAEQMTHENLTQLRQDFSIHLAYHKTLSDTDNRYFSRRTAILAAILSISGVLSIAVINFVLSRILVIPTP